MSGEPSELETEIKNSIAAGQADVAKAAANGWGARDIAYLIGTITTFIVAMSALLRPETSARKVYAASVVADTHLTDVQVAQGEQITKLQTFVAAEHSDPSPVVIVPHDGGVAKLAKDAGVVATLVPLKPFVRQPPPVSPVPVRFTPPNYENVTGTSDIGPSLTH